MKIDQIQKFDQRQKPAKWTQLFGTGLIRRVRLLTIWAPPFIAVMVWRNLCYNRNPKWFFIFQVLFDARSRYYIE